MEKGGIIRFSNSAWHSPVVIIKKKNGNDLRLCVDYRFLNSITKDDSFPLPVIDELLIKVQKRLHYCVTNSNHNTII